MKQTKIGFTVTHTKNGLSPSEKHPVVDCFLDSQWKRVATRVDLSKGPRQRVQVTGEISRSVKTIPQTSQIGFASWAWRANETGNQCLIDTGVTQISLREIQLGLKQGNGTYTRKLNLIMHTAENFKKGQIEVTFHEDDFKLGKDVTIESRIGSSVNQIGSQMMAYINGNLEMEQHMDETVPGTERMRVPYFYGEAGIQSTGGVPLPAVAYVLAETPISNTTFWVNAHENVMRRDNAKWEQLTLEGKARATILMISYCPQYLDYVGDKVDRARRHVEYGRKIGYEVPLTPAEIAFEDHAHVDRIIVQNSQQPYENFGDSITTWSGDCEDLATGIAQIKNALEEHVFPPGPEFDKFRYMQRISHSYINPLSLDVVRGAQVNQVAHVGAHMNDNFIPLDMFYKEMRKTKDGRELIKEMSKPERPSIFKKSENLIEGLPFMIGEGTGMYEPLGIENPLMPVMSYVYQCPSLSSFKKPISHTRREIGSFFIGSLVGMTDYFYRRGARTPLAFWYCTKKEDGTLTRGATYDDMINNNDKVSLRPQPAPTRPIMGLIEESIRVRVPPRPLTLTEMKKHERNPHLDAIVKAVNDFGRQKGSPAVRVPVYVRPHQLSAKLSRDIVRDFRSLQNVWKVDYTLERITDEIWGYQMNVYVN